MNNDLISRQQAIDALDKRFDSIPMEQTTEILQLRRDLRQLPSAHKEIICCKDCRYYDHEGMLCLDIYGYGRRWEENDWCSYAERRGVTT